MLKRIGLVLLASFLLVSLAASPSSANTRAVRDGYGDNKGKSFDIRKVGFKNGGHAVTASVRMLPKYRVSSNCVTLVIDVGRRRGKAYNAVTCANLRKQKAVVSLRKANRSGHWRRVHCRNLGATWGKTGDAVRIKVPQSCLKGTRTARFRAVTSHRKASGIDKTRSVRVRRG